MADYDLTPRIAPNLDRHLVFPLLEFLQERQFYPDEQILKAKIELLNKTNMVDYAMDIHKSLYHTEDVPQDMVDRRAEVVSRLKALEESAAPLVAFLQNPAAFQELRADKQYNLQMLNERYQIGPDQIEALYQYAKFQFECGNYSGAADYLYQYRALCTNSERSLSALWGKLAAEVLMQNWDIALEELNRLKEIIDSKNFASPMNQVQSRIWLMHWSLFIFFNHDNGRTQIIDLFNQDKYLNAIQTNAPHLLRYLATAFIVNKRRRPQFKDFIKVIQQEQHSYKDPITEFLTCVYINYDFDGAQKKMRECEELILNDPFLGKRLEEGNLSSVPLRDEFLENARLFIFETYCRIHQRIDVSILAEKLNLNYEEAERWIVNLVRTSKLDAKIDSKTGTVIMEPNHPNVYEQLIDHTKALSGHTYKMSKNRAIIDGKDKHTKAIWDYVTLDVFNEKTGRDYDYKQLKNKWTALRKDWQVWNALIGADTGLGWGPLRQTIDATNQWWEDKLKLVPEAFRVKGLQKVDQLDILFKDAAVTGVGAWAPSQGLLQINDNEEGNNNDTVGDTEFDDNDFNNMESATNDVDASEAASKLSEKLDRMCEVIENRRKDSPGCSILEVMNALKGLPGIVEGDELYMKAADIFVKREYREIFAAIGKPQIQVAWLKQKKL